MTLLVVCYLLESMYHLMTKFEIEGWQQHGWITIGGSQRYYDPCPGQE